ncbi:MAG: hypothetical protein V4662_13270 [Verrucomicrobiota bacterium]
MIYRLLSLVLLTFSLAACGPVDREGHSLADYESAGTEALLREVIRTLPDPNPGVQKSYSITLGEIVRGRDFTPASVPFMQRFADTKLRIISPTVLNVAPPEGTLIDPDLRVPIYLLQVRSMTQTSGSTWDYEVGWSYKKHFQRQNWKVTSNNGEWKIEPGAVIEGNWPPAAATEAAATAPAAVPNQ